MKLFEGLKNKSFLISGANGYLGSNMIKYLIKNKCQIFALYNKSKKNIVKSKYITLIKSDLSKKISLSKIPKKVNYIIHFACNPNDRAAVTNKKYLIMDNSLIDFNFFKLCENIKHDKFLYSSSCAVYDDNYLRLKKRSQEKEVMYPYNPDGLYGLCKLLSEKYIEQTKLNFVICRIFSVYGNDSATLINQWNERIKKKKQVDIWTSEKINRSWLHIEDLVKAMALICIKSSTNKYFDIASDENLSLKEIFKIISHFHKGSKTSYKVKNTIDAGPRYRYALRKNLDLLGFKQSIYLRKGIHLINSHQN